LIEIANFVKQITNWHTTCILREWKEERGRWKKMSYKANVLVVDDEQVVCNSCRKILKQEGHNVQVALNGREALKKVEEDKYDVVIADWKMPEIDGMEVLRIVKKNHPDIVLIMITGYPSVSSAVKAMRLGVSNYVSKPFSPEILNEALDKALEERKSQRKDMFYYQNYIWAKLQENGILKVGVNNLFRQRVGDILYVDLPFNRTEVEQERLCIRILASDKQVHKLYAPIRGRVIKTNYEINFNTDLINKDPFGKGWIAEIQPSHLQEDLQKWSGDTSVLDKKEKGGLDHKKKKTPGVTEASPETKITGEKSTPRSQEKQADESHKVRIDVPKFFLSAITSRLFFLALLPACLGLMIKALFYGVSPRGAN